MTFSARGFARFAASLVQHGAGHVGVVSKIYGWTVDRRREARIRALRLRMSVAHDAGDYLSVDAIARQLFAECDARSPRAMSRLERRALAAMDEHMRAALGK